MVALALRCIHPKSRANILLVRGRLHERQTFSDSASGEICSKEFAVRICATALLAARHTSYLKNVGEKHASIRVFALTLAFVVFLSIVVR